MKDINIFLSKQNITGIDSRALGTVCYYPGIAGSVLTNYPRKKKRNYYDSSHNDSE